ncbi:recombinase family protein [Methylomagnum ishizawai]|uniref:recombinase family protein n=1 Tax=Methylomagnum ishizawai TaxID=1760988 RepID=UPI003CCEE8C7
MPYGKRLSEDGKTLVDDEAEQEVIRLVKLLREGGMSYPKIAAELEARDMKPRGKTWHPQTVKNIAEAA